MKSLFLPFWTHKFQAFYISLVISILTLFLIYQSANAVVLEPIKLQNENFSMQIAQFVASSQPKEPKTMEPNLKPIKEEIKKEEPPKKPIKKHIKKEIKKPSKNPEKPKDMLKDTPKIEETKASNLAQTQAVNPAQSSNLPSPATTSNLPQTLTYGKTNDERLKKIKMAIDEAGFYPRKARKMRLSGEVWVEFLWQKNGVLKDLKIKKSSSHDVLDESALQTIKTASKDFPILDKDIRLEVPIVYDLK